MNPFGAPITNATLAPMKRYRGKTITQEDRAREAMRLIQAGNKNMNALNHALSLKADYGDGVSTLILIYNASGDTLEIVEDQKMDWLGSVYKEEPPRTFENGQWLGFVHVHPTSQSLGSKGARVFRGKTVDGQVCDYMVAWCAPWHRKYDNSAYTEVREKDYFPQEWNHIKTNLLEKANKISKDERHQYCVSTVSIGGLTTCEFVAILNHKFTP
ncbi:23 kDa jasmonate-induced protein-like [Silene latifolia]|uniref:23 kDa jasmonate-induced protein-like n=1 Tax=Silene latifolia TaxID=37657 RepID=UPI003D77BF10